MAGEREATLDYFHRELRYLRQAGGEFAKKHPKVAQRLDIRSMGESADPHVERLLESFAFLTARLSREIDDRLPLISSALLEVLYPHLMAPMPSMSIAQFQVNSVESKLTTGYRVPRETPLISYADDDVSCRFTSAYDVTLWPLEIQDAAFVSAERYKFTTVPRASHFLRLRITAPNISLEALNPSDITFFIQADRALGFLLYELLFAQERPQIGLCGDDENVHILPQAKLLEVGYGADETLMPGVEKLHPAYQLVQEFFHFPEKFMFFKLQGLSFAGRGNTADLLVSLDSRIALDKQQVSAENFLLGCTPIVNLFSKITDPVRIDQRHTEYRLVPDQRRERTTEIHSIRKLITVQDGAGTEVEMAPYFSFNHGDLESGKQSYWLGRRTPTHRADLPGTDMYVSFVDAEFKPHLLTDKIVYAHALCTNRFLATQVPMGGRLELEEPFPVSQIVCLQRPNPPIYTPRDGETLWKLVSQLSLNHLSLSDGINVLRESLRLLAGEQVYQHVDLDVIKGMDVSSSVCRMGDEAWRGFVRGQRISLQIQESLQGGTSAFLMGRVLQQYFAVNVSINSFVEIELRGFPRNEVWKRWAPQSGYQRLL